MIASTTRAETGHPWGDPVKSARQSTASIFSPIRLEIDRTRFLKSKLGGGYDPMMDAPSLIDEKQWSEMGLRPAPPAGDKT
jgi:hypothetical protein